LFKNPLMLYFELQGKYFYSNVSTLEVSPR